MRGIGKRGQVLPKLPELPSLPSKKAKSVKNKGTKKKVHKGKGKSKKRASKKRKPVSKKKVLKKKAVKKNVASKNVGLKKKSKERGAYEAKIHREGKHGDILESYDLVVDGARAKAEIVKEEMGMVYNLYIPEVSKATSGLLDDIRNSLITATTVSMKELTDPAMFQKIKMRFMDDARKMLKEKLPHTEKKIEDFLVGKLMQEMLGLGNIEFLIADEHLEEIVIPSAKEPIRVFFKKRGWLITNIKVGKEDEIVNYANIIARRVGKQITVLSPLLDAHLVTGDRINAVLYPVNTKGNTITIRKFARDPFTIVDMITGKTCSIDVAALIWLAIEYEMNVLISGGTGSGKTSFLNACLPFIPPNQRIISIEDTRELMLPEFLYWSPLVTRTPNPEGKGEVSMLHLLVNSLRMRPDRIILGEMRKQEEAMVLFEAMHTGHSVYSTVHADSAPETISRLVNPPLNVPPNLLKSVNLNVVMFRDRRKGIRRTFQVAEFDADISGAKSTILYRWVAERDEIVKHSESSRFFEDLSRNTGMNDSELKRDLQEKRDILNWLIKNESRSLDEIGKVMNMYYRNKELLLKAMHTNNKTIVFGKHEKKKETEKKETVSGFSKNEVIEAVKPEPSADKKEREKELDNLMKNMLIKEEKK